MGGRAPGAPPLDPPMNGQRENESETLKTITPKDHRLYITGRLSH